MAAINEQLSSVEATRPPLSPETRRCRAGPRGEAARESFAFVFGGIMSIPRRATRGKISLFRIMQFSHPPPKDLLCVEIVQYDDAMWKGFVTTATNNRRMVRLAGEV